MKLASAFMALSIIAGTAGAQSVKYPTAQRQIAAAVSTMPANLRANATVLGYNAAGKLVTLRKGSNDMVCLADDPAQKMFHVACYHRSLEPFMVQRSTPPRTMEPNRQ